MSDLTIRALTEQDYHHTLCVWWKQWGWTPPPIDFLPDGGKGGIIVMDAETPICAGFMYLTNSKVAWVDWIISNKEYRLKGKRKKALLELINCLTQMCKVSGSSYSYALIKHQSLVNLYKEAGYTEGDSYSSEMIKKL